MKVLFLALTFPNSEVTTNLYTDLIEEFNNNNHEVFVVAPAYDQNKLGLQKEGGINVIRVKTRKLFNVGLIEKGIANMLLPYQYKSAIKKHFKSFDFDLILIPTPPITLVSVLSWLKKKSKAKTYLILRDIFPQNAVDLGMMKYNSLLHKFFRKKEKNLYKIVDSIGCMSQGNVDYVVKHNPEIDTKKLHLLPNWEKLIDKKIKISPSIKEKYNLKDKFILIFGGNIGVPQKLDNILNLAKEVKDYQDIVFLIIGKGSKRDELQQKIEQQQINNIKLFDFIPREEYNQLLSLSDVGLIALNEDFSIPNIPSKSLSYFNNKKPILAAIDKNTDYGKILEDQKFGFWAEANKTDELKKHLLLLYNNQDLRKELGENGYKYLVNHLTANKAYKTIDEAVSKLF